MLRVGRQIQLNLEILKVCFKIFNSQQPMKTPKIYQTCRQNLKPQQKIPLTEVSIDLSKEYESTQLADSTSVTPSPTALSIDLPSKKITKTKDIRLKSTEKYETLFPDFYFSASQNGWMCKICTTFANGQDDRAFIERPGNIGDHPTERFTDHLKTKGHKDALSNRMAYLEMCNRGTDVWKLAREASLASTATKIDHNRFVIKSLFRIVHPMIIKN